MVQNIVETINVYMENERTKVHRGIVWNVFNTNIHCLNGIKYCKIKGDQLYWWSGHIYLYIQHVTVYTPTASRVIIQCYNVDNVTVYPHCFKINNTML